MTYKVKLIEESKKNLKELVKKFPLIKKDIFELIDILEVEPIEYGIHLGKNIYKTRVKNSNNNKGKSAGYRVIYYVVTKDMEVLILKIYSKNTTDSVSDKEILEILEKELEDWTTTNSHFLALHWRHWLTSLTQR